MKNFFYVYILVSEVDGTIHNSGLTRDLQDRLMMHNQGRCRHTRKHRPWRIETAIAFQSENKARTFEKYLKTGSGRQFGSPSLLIFALERSGKRSRERLP